MIVHDQPATRRPAVDPFPHQPARLGVMSLLAPAEWADFAFLRDALETTDSALSKQVSALEDAGYVDVHKEHAPRRRTSVRITPAGRTAFDSYLDTLQRIVSEARSGRAGA